MYYIHYHRIPVWHQIGLARCIICSVSDHHRQGLRHKATKTSNQRVFAYLAETHTIHLQAWSDNLLRIPLKCVLGLYVCDLNCGVKWNVYIKLWSHTILYLVDILGCSKFEPRTANRTQSFHWKNKKSRILFKFWYICASSYRVNGIVSNWLSNIPRCVIRWNVCVCCVILLASSSASDFVGAPIAREARNA